jgi:hypothetical protein
MTPGTNHDIEALAAPMLRWMLERHTDAITCELDARGNRSYEVCVVPHSNPSSAVIERFGAPLPAVLRHAEITKRLRENGWMVIDRVAAKSIQSAA